MASVNKVILVGNLGADPETRYAPSGDAICNIRLATTESWKDKATGEKRDATEWHRVVLYRKLGEIAGQYLKKGASVYIEGKIKTRKWQDKDGQDRYSTEIEATEMKMLGGRAQGAGEGNEAPAPSQRGQSNAGGGAPARKPAAATGGGGGFGDFDDDIPFASCAIEDDVIGRGLARRVKKVA